MATLPQFIEEDIQQMDAALTDFLSRSEASSALIIDKGGFLITHQGNPGQFDMTSIAALASGAYMANQTIAQLVNETNFSSVYQQGERFSLLVQNIDEQCLLVVIFRAHIGVGAVKYYASRTIEFIAKQLEIAQARSPEAGLDLSVLNLANPSELFRKRHLNG